MKKVYFGKEAEDKVFAGAEELYNAVKVTLGPKGRNFMIAKKYMSPFLTHDGVTVATNFQSSEPSKEVGASFIRDAAKKSAVDVGDGTTTTTILTYSLLKGYRNEIVNPMVLSKELLKEAELLSEQLKPLDTVDLKSVVTLSAQDETIGDVVAKALEAVGKDGSVVIEEKNDEGIDLEIIDGMQIRSGFVSPYMATDDRGRAVIENANIFIYNASLNTENNLLAVLQKAGEKATKLLIIADEISREVVARIQQLNAGNATIVAVLSPELGARRVSVLEDVCSTTGCKMYTSGEIEANMFGTASKVIVDSDSTILTVPPNQERVELLQKELNAAKTERDIKFTKERIASLQGKIATIYVGGMEAQRKEKVFRIDDAVQAGKSALDKGTVVGGGLTYLSLQTTDTVAGRLFKKTLEEPFNHLMENAGLDAKEKLSLIDKTTGIDVMHPEQPVDLVESGIIEPLALVEGAIKTSASIVSSLITMGGLIVEEEDEN
jgi:chaperonin GroEL